MRPNQAAQGGPLSGRIHNDICNVPLYPFPGFRLQIKLTKAKSIFYLIERNAESKMVFKFLDAQDFVNLVKPSPLLVLANNATLAKGLSCARI